nr:MAG TPA: hypothetical protein [Caudoviricetes sp.]
MIPWTRKVPPVFHPTYFPVINPPDSRIFRCSIRLCQS